MQRDVSYMTKSPLSDILKTFISEQQIFIPPATKLVGIYWNHHVRLSSTFRFPAHNCFPFTPIIMKLHMQTPHEAMMCPIDFEVQRSRSQCINYWKWFPAHNCFPFTPIIMKLHMQTPHEARMCPIDFEVQRSRSQCINYWNGFRRITAFPLHLSSWNFTCRLPMSQGCAL